MRHLNVDIYVITTFISSATYLALAFLVYFRVAHRTLKVKRFIVFCLGYSVYNISLVLQFITFNREIAAPSEAMLICIHAYNIIGSFIPLLYADFLLTFAERRPKWYWGAYGIVTIMVPIFVRHERSHALLIGRHHYYPPPFIVAPLLMFLFFVITSWTLISLRLAYRDTDSPIQRKMLRALFWASFLVVPAAASDMAFMLRNKGILPLSPLVGLGYVIYFSYAIVKYRFLGIRIAVRKSIIYIALTVPFTSFFLVAAMISYRSSFGIASIHLTILWALLAAIVFYLIRERLEILVDRVMFKKSYQYQRSLEQLDRDIMNEVDPGSLISKLVVWLEESLKLEHADIFLPESHIDEQEQCFRTVKSDKRIPSDSLLLRSLRENQEAIFRADLPVLPRFRYIYQDLDKEFQMLSAEVCVPLATDRLLFSVDLKFQRDLNENSVSQELRQEFENNRISLSDASSSIKEAGGKWLVTDENSVKTYTVKREESKLNVYTGSKLGGIIVCGDRKYGKFEEEDRRLLGIAAYNIAFAVERAQLVLELKSANQFKWDLVRWLSHDLNTPLTPIKMIVNALRSKVGNGAEDQKAISVVMGEITRLQSLISGLDIIADLGVISNRLPAKNESIDLGHLIAETVTLFEWQARECGITLSCQIPFGIHRIRGNVDRMKQALTNLISNSIKYNCPGGKVEITVAQEDNCVVISVTDSGIGMSEVEEALVFEPFYRGNRAKLTGKGGVGLGLAIVRRIMEEHGGTIQVESELSVGTVIILTMPCEQETVCKESY